MKIIFDLDGTLADVSHRVHYVRNGNRNWEAFFNECDKDMPITPIIETLQHLWRMGNNIQIWSGRSDEVKDKTLNWLERNIEPRYTKYWSQSKGKIVYSRIDGSDLLKYMRPSSSYISDVELKEGWLKESIANGWKPDLVFDDHQSVVDMWRRNGIQCCQVAPGDF